MESAVQCALDAVNVCDTTCFYRCFFKTCYSASKKRWAPCCFNTDVCGKLMQVVLADGPNTCLFAFGSSKRNHCPASFVHSLRVVCDVKMLLYMWRHSPAQTCNLCRASKIGNVTTSTSQLKSSWPRPPSKVPVTRHAKGQMALAVFRLCTLRQDANSLNMIIEVSINFSRLNYGHVLCRPRRSSEPLFIGCLVGRWGQTQRFVSPQWYVSSFKKTAQKGPKKQCLESCLARVEGPLVGFSSACGSSNFWRRGASGCPFLLMNSTDA